MKTTDKLSSVYAFLHHSVHDSVLIVHRARLQKHLERMHDEKLIAEGKMPVMRPRERNKKGEKRAEAERINRLAIQVRADSDTACPFRFRDGRRITAGCRKAFPRHAPRALVRQPPRRQKVLIRL